jgi:hypothetical protein
MSQHEKADPVEQTQINEHDDETGARMRKRDEYLTRHLRRMRIIVRILDFGFGWVISVL